MYEEIKWALLVTKPLDSNLLLSTEGGTCFYKENSENLARMAIKEIVERIIERCNPKYLSTMIVK